MKTKSSLPPAWFIAGALGLDVLNSLARLADELVDWWSNGDNFLSWMKQAGLLTDDDIALAKSNMSTKQLDRLAANARELREWFRGFVKAHKGKPLTRHALPQLDPLKRLLEADEVFWSLEPASSPSSKRAAASFHLRARRRWSKPESLLAPIAEQIAEFISAADFRYVKACPGKNCVLLFLDQTRQHKRRWCSMVFCGNRAKQEAHLARLKKHENQI
ncbi:MAG TPA: CGNR zinc finger domain-containing protein [Verrucomicrobiae bacterium]|jgi:predicted RNA-binding Zn ribbon-like protein|nr:CGNR zinc finger domain-containing protein [Verrucomicrobiae bacterium]